MKPKKAMVERIATITPIATRNTPFIISLTMPQRMPNTPKAVRNIKPHIVSPMHCAICLKSAVAVIPLSVFEFYNTVYPAVQIPAESCLVGCLVFRPMSVLVHEERAEYVGKVKPPTLQGYCAFEIDVAVYCTGKPVLFLSVQFLALVQFGTKSVHLAILQFLQVGDFPRHEFCCYRCSHIRLVFCFLMRIKELRELSFKLLYLPLVYPTFF